MTPAKVTSSVKLGSTDIKIGAVGHGLMLMTWIPVPVPDEQCFEAIKAGIDALPEGTKAFLNSGEFYAHDFGTANLELLSRSFARYPDYADKTFLSVKGGIDWSKHGPDGSLEFLRKSVDNCLKALGPHKLIDLFEPARIDSSIPIEEYARNLLILKNEGKFKYLGLSECKAETIRKIHGVVPVTAVEIEISPFSYEERTQAVINTTKELGITVFAYSPLGRGLLTGQIASLKELQPGDMRHRLSRFQEEALAHNRATVEELTALAKSKGLTSAQLCIAWVKALGKDHVVPIPGSSKASRTLENLAAGDVDLSAEDVLAINKIIEKHGIRGDRGFGGDERKAHLWG